MSRNEYDLAVGSWAEDAAVSEPSSLSRHRAWPANHLEILRKARPRAPFKGKSIQRCNLCPRVVLNPSIRNLLSTTQGLSFPGRWRPVLDSLGAEAAQPPFFRCLGVLSPHHLATWFAEMEARDESIVVLRRLRMPCVELNMT